MGVQTLVGVSAVKRNFPKVLATHLHGEMDVEQAIRKAFHAMDDELTKILLFGAGQMADCKVSSGTVACLAQPDVDG